MKLTNSFNAKPVEGIALITNHPTEWMSPGDKVIKKDDLTIRPVFR